MAVDSLMHGPLTGFRILDLSRVLSGPAATMLLADQGADVIKVEPLAGDITRQMGVGNNGLSAGYLNINRGKRAIALNLKSAEGIEIVKKIALRSDVFVQNFRPGAIQNMGLGYDEIKKIKPDIIYVSISGFGEDGPYAHKRVYDPVIQALSGITDIQADAETGRPRMIRTVIPDKTTALTAAQAITAGLLSRERSGKGQHIKLAMIDATIAYLWPEGMINLTFVDDERVPGVGQLAQDLVFKTSDGYITAGAMSDIEWAGMCATLERPQWLDDPRFNTTAARFLNAKVRLEETAKILETASSEHWLTRLDENGVPCAPILMRPEVISHPQVVANNLIHEYDHPMIGRVRQPRPAARFENSEPELHPLAARLGEHNGEVLAELGYSASEIQSLTDSGVLSA
ncbi:MAG: crotonobetainyl-CoA:carnitine CoA-transferase CaiB-like acyl-CoA transferase [Gammaproteobacteria bacterium]|jgi:crotonobetainyl-CoA:carnitine CoA-transferase CaiB-like acyl-CoA transferase